MNVADLDIEPEPVVEMPDGIEPEPEPQAPSPKPLAVAAAEPVLALAEVLPADFELPRLVKWVPSLELKQRLDLAIAHAGTVDVASELGLDHADAAMAAIRGCVKAIESDFDEPKRLAFDLHKSITGRLAEWVKPATETIAKVGRLVAAEHRRRDEAAAAVRREQQRLADEAAREAARKAAEAAKAQGAPTAVVETMKAQAAVTKAPPVPVLPTAPAPLAHSTVTKTWKARIAGTPADAAPNPSMSDLSPAQQAEVLKLMKDVVTGGTPLTVFEINWSALNARAKAEKSTLVIPGVEAYEELSTRAKPGRRA